MTIARALPTHKTAERLLWLVGISLALFLILASPGFLKPNYLFFLYLGFILLSVFLIVRKKKDFLILLFIVSLSSTLFNINVKRYIPQLGELIPWISLPDILLMIMLAAEAVKIGVKKTSFKFPKAGNAAFLVLIGSFALSYMFIAPRYFEHQNLGFFSLFSIIKGYLIFVFFYNYLENSNRFRSVIISFAFVVVLQFGFMLYQWISGNFMTLVNLVYETVEGTPIEKYGIARKAFGTFNFPSIAAGVINIIYPVSLAFTSLKDFKKDRVLTWSKYLIIVLAPACVLLSGGRYSVVALFFVTPVALFFLARRYKQRGFARFSAVILLAFVSLGVISLAISPLAGYWKERLSYQDLVVNSLEFRLLIYKIGIRALSSGIYLGVGWGNGDLFSLSLLNNAREVGMYNFGLHNGYVAILIENGVLGLIIYLGWYVALLRASFRRHEECDLSRQFAFLAGIFTVIIIQMLLVDTQGAFIKNQVEFLHFCLCLAFLRGYDDTVRSKLVK
jgi:O-antigen ligase